MALAVLLTRLPAGLDAQLQRDADLSMADYMVLAMLSDAPDNRMRMTELAAYSNTSASRLSRVAARLENSGFIRRTMAPHDRRAVLAELTDRGHQKLAVEAPGHVENVRRLIFDRLSAEQVTALNEIARALLQDEVSDGPGTSFPDVAGTDS